MSLFALKEIKVVDSTTIMAYPKFEDLPISTKSVMVYTNLELDLSKLYSSLPCIDPDSIEIPLTKKKKRPDMHRIFVPYGTIISIRRLRGGKYECRGIVTKKEKVNISNLRIKRDNGDLTSSERENLKKLEEVDRKNVLDFQNQVCIMMNLGIRKTRKKSTSVVVSANANIMAFHNSFKIVGCKTDEEAHTIVRILWNSQLIPQKSLSDGVKIQNPIIVHSGNAISNIPGCYTLTNGDLKPRFLIDVVMTNFDFHLRFPIDRKKLNVVMNQSTHPHMVSSMFEPTSHTNVKIWMEKYQPEDWFYDCLEFEDKKEKILKLRNNPYKNPINNKKSSKHHTFLVPQSSKVIISGKFIPLLREQYQFFLDIIEKNRDILEDRETNSNKTPLSTGPYEGLF